MMIDLAAPAAGIADPVASMSPLNRDCAPGQVDVNTATAPELSAGLGIPSGPTLDRVIAMRPWLKPADLISVPGMPAEMLSTFVERGCATPTTLPMLTPRACLTDTRATDVQSADARTISSTLRLPLSTSQSLVAARPLPQDLAQVVAPRVPGLSRPTVERLLKEDKVCVTPAPFTFAGTTWRWVGASTGAVVTSSVDARYALIVPPGRVQSQSGIWGSVTPDLEAELPTADLHLHGSWIPEVAGRLPDASDGNPMVVHETSVGGTSVSWGSSVSREAGGTIVTALNSLSVQSSADRDPLCDPAAANDLAMLFCAPNPRDLPLPILAQNQARRAGEYIAKIPESGGCPNAGRAVARGEIIFGMNCVADSNGDVGTWTFSNNTGGELAGVFSSFGAVMARAPREAPGSTVSPAVVDHSKYQSFGRPLAKYLVDHHNLLLAGTEVSVSKRVGSGESTYSWYTPDERVLGELWVLFNFIKTVDAALTLSGVEDFTVTQAVGCFKALKLGEDSLSTALQCAQALVDSRLNDAAREADRLGDVTKARKLQSLRAGISKVAFLVFEGPGIGASLLFHFAARSQGVRQVTLQYLSPPAGTGGGTTRPGASPYNWDLDGLANDGTFIARTAEGDVRRGYLVDSDTGIAREIKDGGDFLCYAKKRLVLDFVEVQIDGAGTRFLNVYPKAEVVQEKAPSCTWRAPEPAWDFSPAPGGNTPVNVILRGVSIDGRPARTALVNTAGALQEIPDGGTYVCLAAQVSPVNPVIWNVPNDAFDNWPSKGPEARCGPGA